MDNPEPYSDLGLTNKEIFDDMKDGEVLTILGTKYEKQGQVFINTTFTVDYIINMYKHVLERHSFDTWEDEKGNTNA